MQATAKGTAFEHGEEELLDEDNEEAREVSPNTIWLVIS